MPIFYTPELLIVTEDDGSKWVQLRDYIKLLDSIKNNDYEFIEKAKGWIINL